MTSSDVIENRFYISARSKFFWLFTYVKYKQVCLDLLPSLPPLLLFVFVRYKGMAGKIPPFTPLTF